MIKKYIRGVPGRGNEVFEVLQNLGGVNKLYFDFEDTEILYFIEKDKSIYGFEDNTIGSCLMIESFEEIKLPELEKKYHCYITIFAGKDCYICKNSKLGVERIILCKGCNSFKYKISIN